MKILSRENLNHLLDFGYAKCGKAYSKDLAVFENGDVAIQIIIDPYGTEEEIILNVSIDGIEITEERERYFCEEYHVDIWILADEIQLLRNLDIME